MLRKPRQALAIWAFGSRVPLPFLHSIISIRAPTLKVKVFAWSPLATNSFGLGRLFYKSSRQLQNFRRHGD